MDSMMMDRISKASMGKPSFKVKKKSSAPVGVTAVIAIGKGGAPKAQKGLKGSMGKTGKPTFRKRAKIGKMVRKKK